MPKTSSKSKKESSAQSTYFKTSAPKMPDGYYSDDKPNPNLRAFVEQHLKEKPYDPATDAYNVPAFNTPIETTKATAIYNMHTYWSKKPHDAIRQYIRHYTQEGDLVLDPFCGSGGTALAALMEGRKAIAIDLSPAATFVTAASILAFTCTDFEKAIEKIGAVLRPIVDSKFYLQDYGGFVRAVVYSERFRCSRCFETVVYLDAESGDKRQFRGRVKAKEQCPYCSEPIKTGSDDRLGFVAAELHVSPRMSSREIKKLKVVGNKDIATRFPVLPKSMPAHLRVKLEGHIQPRLWKNLAKAQAVTAGDLFSDANLSILLTLDNEITKLEDVSDESKVLLKLALHAILYNCTRMYRYRIHTPGGGGFSGTYYIPHLSKCINPWIAFMEKCDETLRAIQDTQSIGGVRTLSAMVSCESADQIAQHGRIPFNSIDYIFTDPPYGGTYHYGALNFLWEAWRGCDLSWRSNEIVISEDGTLTYLDWKNRMSVAMQQAFNILKPNRYVSLCFHGEVELWEAVNDIMAEIGFVPEKSESALFIDTSQKSYNQVTGVTAKKRDLVINFRKPKPEELGSALQITGNEDETTFNEKVYLIIHDYLLANPGATKDRIYDEVVSRMVRAGQMQAHNFDELLAHVAEPARGDHTSGQWYLKEDGTLVDSAETKKEDAAAKTLSAAMTRRLRANPDAEGVHYSDLFEEYIMRVADKPRRALADWLPDYFFKTEQGTWRLPANDEEEKLKAHARASGANRRVKRFVSFLQQGIPVPDKERASDATLAEWIRQSKRSGMFEYGKLIYEKGGMNLDALPEELLMDVEEDYQTCVRMLGRVK